MFATAGGSSFAGSPLTWSIFFARQPEPDLEFTEEELEQTSNIRSSSPMKPPKNKKSGRSPLLWILLLVLIGGGAYVAMEPELVMDLAGPLLGETPEPPPPTIARRPAPPKPPMAAIPPAQSQPSATAPAVPPGELPQPAVRTPAPPPIQAEPPTSAPAVAQPPAPTMAKPSVPATPSPASPGNTSQKAPIATAPAAPAAQPSSLITDIQDPLFGEGQRVTLLPSPGAPREKVALMKDAVGTKPGPAVPPGTNFTILDGDLQERGWVYYVRSDYGTKGWLNEKQLRAKR